MGTARSKAVAAAVRKIRGLYQLGGTIPRKEAHGAAYDRGVVDRHAKLHRCSDTKVRQARQFAALYTAADLDRLCARVERVQSGQDAKSPVFGPTHVVRLLSVRPRKDRAALQTEAIEGAWSCQRLEAEIAKRYGTRRGGGRRRKLAGDPAGVLAQLERACEAWRRWRDELTRAGEADDGPPEALAALPADVRHSFAEAVAAVTKLHAAVVGELGRVQPGRQARSMFRDQNQGEAEAPAMSKQAKNRRG